MTHSHEDSSDPTESMDRERRQNAIAIRDAKIAKLEAALKAAREGLGPFDRYDPPPDLADAVIKNFLVHMKDLRRIRAAITQINAALGE